MFTWFQINFYGENYLVFIIWNNRPYNIKSTNSVPFSLDLNIKSVTRRSMVTNKHCYYVNACTGEGKNIFKNLLAMAFGKPLEKM